MSDRSPDCPDGPGGPTDAPDRPADAPALPDPEPPDGVRTRTATPADELDVRRVLDGAMLEVADDALAAALAAGTALVALAARGGARDPAVAGALVGRTTPPTSTRSRSDGRVAVAASAPRSSRGRSRTPPRPATTG